jgi:hypothetical protein
MGIYEEVHDGARLDPQGRYFALRYSQSAWRHGGVRTLRALHAAVENHRGSSETTKRWAQWLDEQAEKNRTYFVE